MHAFLVQELDIKTEPIDTLTIEPETSIGIEEVRNIQHFLSRKPMLSDQNTIVINQAHLLTIPAQNALLKVLEEPPGRAQIYLVTNFPHQLLPTVLSRVQLEPNTQNLEPNPKDIEKTKKFLSQLLTAGAGERLKLIEEQKFTRESALEFLDQLEYVIHDDLSLGSRIYNLVSDTRRYLRANCNVKLCLNNFVVQL